MFNKTPLFTPSNTPKIIKGFIGLSIFLTLICSIIKPLIFYVGFSKLGFDANFFWQAITFTFLHSQTGEIHLFSILYLFLSTYVLWVAGSEIVLKKKSYSFLILFLGTGLLTAFASYFIMGYFQNFYILFGMKYTTFSLLTAWMMLHPSARIFLFHSFPAKVSHLVSAFVTIQGLTFLSNGEYLNFTNSIISVLFAYFYSVIFWSSKSPYLKLNSFEEKVSRLFRKRKKGNIYDFNNF